jgi:hypothetical protein
VLYVDIPTPADISALATTTTGGQILADARTGKMVSIS